MKNLNTSSLGVSRRSILLLKINLCKVYFKLVLLLVCLHHITRFDLRYFNFGQNIKTYSNKIFVFGGYKFKCLIILQYLIRNTTGFQRFVLNCTIKRVRRAFQFLVCKHIYVLRVKVIFNLFLCFITPLRFCLNDVPFLGIVK